jgi:hypothetical protein
MLQCYTCHVDVREVHVFPLREVVHAHDDGMNKVSRVGQTAQGNPRLPWQNGVHITWNTKRNVCLNVVIDNVKLCNTVWWQRNVHYVRNTCTSPHTHALVLEWNKTNTQLDCIILNASRNPKCAWIAWGSAKLKYVLDIQYHKKRWDILHKFNNLFLTNWILQNLLYMFCADFR